MPTPAQPMSVPWVHRSRSTAADIREVLLVNRFGTADPAHLEKRLSALPDPDLLPDMAIAAARFAEAIRRREKILIHGDYDTDGTAACAILERFVAHHRHEAEVHIPDRMIDGYGLSQGSFDAAKAAKPRLFMTVDCGTVDKGWAPRIREETGADVLITDHHVGRVRPDALAVVNPNALSAHDHPLHMLCGATVAWCLCLATARVLAGQRKLPDADRVALLRLIQLAGLATVADCVPLVGPNRPLVDYALTALETDPVMGIALLKDRLRLSSIGTREIGFRIGPVINANGRLGDATRSYRILAKESAAAVSALVDEAIAENDKRRTLTETYTEQALEMVERRGPGDAIVEVGPWHHGIVGIVAGRLLERFRRPTCVLGETDDPDLVKGSLRSIDGFDIGAFIHRCIDDGLLKSGGGHPKAAGCSLPIGRVDEFRARMAAAVAATFASSGGVPPPSEHYEVEATWGSMDGDLCRFCDALGPFGQQMPAPRILVRGLHTVGAARRISPNYEHAKGKLSGGAGDLPFFAPGLIGAMERLSGGSFDAILTPVIERFRGNTTPSLQIVAIRDAV